MQSLSWKLNKVREKEHERDAKYNDGGDAEKKNPLGIYIQNTDEDWLFDKDGVCTIEWMERPHPSHIKQPSVSKNHRLSFCSTEDYVFRWVDFHCVYQINFSLRLFFQWFF